METQIYPGNEDDEDSYDDMEACSLRCVKSAGLALTYHYSRN